MAARSARASAFVRGRLGSLSGSARSSPLPRSSPLRSSPLSSRLDLLACFLAFLAAFLAALRSWWCQTEEEEVLGFSRRWTRGRVRGAVLLRRMWWRHSAAFVRGAHTLRRFLASFRLSSRSRRLSSSSLSLDEEELDELERLRRRRLRSSSDGMVAVLLVRGRTVARHQDPKKRMTSGTDGLIFYDFFLFHTKGRQKTQKQTPMALTN